MYSIADFTTGFVNIYVIFCGPEACCVSWSYKYGNVGHVSEEFDLSLLRNRTYGMHLQKKKKLLQKQSQKTKDLHCAQSPH